MEREITSRGSLLDAEGRLREPGWARRLLLDYDRSAIRASAWRIKEWDYYCVLCGDYAIALTIADNAYMGFISASVLDFAARTEASDSVMTAFPMGRMGLPRGSESGPTQAEAGGASLRFEAAGGSRRLSFSWPTFGATAASRSMPRPARSSCCVPLPPDDLASLRPGGPARVGLEGEILLRERPEGESMVIATPFPGAPQAFYYNQKINCQDAEGRFRFGGREYPVVKGKAFAVLDWGRGVWTYSNTWYWGSASGLAGGKSFGFNLGRGFGDTRAAGENAIFHEGRLHKIASVTIELDHRDFMRPWRAVSEDGRLDMTLAPLLDRASTANFGIIASIQHQVFGDWSGRAVLDDGSELRIEGLRGFCEKVVNRW
jgi:hypothetical protein